MSTFEILQSISGHLKKMTLQERLLYQKVKKKLSIYLLLIFTLGGLGVQFFYREKHLAGVLCLVFCWTLIPSFIAIICLFSCKRDIEALNLKLLNNQFISWPACTKHKRKQKKQQYHMTSRYEGVATIFCSA